MDKDKIFLFKNWIENTSNIVFFGGAGVSTESGIPDFRSVDGLYNQSYKYSPEEILSHTFFWNHTEEFYKFYFDKLITPTAKPNLTHEVLAKLENIGKLKKVITQNIDNLHQFAGSKNVLELHGSVYRNYCTRCNRFYDLNYLLNCNTSIPRCACGGVIKPDVVLYEESLSDEILFSSIKAIKEADVLIVGGTSLSVYPAASLVNYYKGNKLVLINKTSTHYDTFADMVFNESLSNVFSELI